MNQLWNGRSEYVGKLTIKFITDNPILPFVAALIANNTATVIGLSERTMDMTPRTETETINVGGIEETKTTTYNEDGTVDISVTDGQGNDQGSMHCSPID